MVLSFNKKDMVSFGKYLLSKKREDSLKQTSIENETSLPYEERFREVYDADYQNWIAIKNNKTNQVKNYCEDDLVGFANYVAIEESKYDSSRKECPNIPIRSHFENWKKQVNN